MARVWRGEAPKDRSPVAERLEMRANLRPLGGDDRVVRGVADATVDGRRMDAADALETRADPQNRRA